jgi:hypothetical protein
MKNIFLKFIICSSVFFTTKNLLNGQNIYTFAGNGVAGFTGDGGQAINAQFNFPHCVVVDLTGNVYIADPLNSRVRKINTSGIITTIAGNGVSGFGGDGGLATNAKLNGPYYIAVDAIGNVYISEYYNHRIRKINTSGIISTFAGNGVSGFGGDGGPATSAQINTPGAICVDTAGNLFIADSHNHRIRKVNTSGTISTFAGTGVYGSSGDGGLATIAKLGYPTYITLNQSGNIFISDQFANTIRQINQAGIISTYAGNGTYGFSGDGGPATNAKLSNPFGLTFDASGNLYIVDYENIRIRKVNTSGTISTFAGTGISGFSGDGGLAHNSQFNVVYNLATDASGNLYFGDCANNRVRVVCVGPCITGIESYSMNYFIPSLFPNPNSGSFIFKIENNIINGQLVLINSLGQKVYDQKVIQGTNEIKTNELPFGLYNYILLQDNQLISSGKLTIE